MKIYEGKLVSEGIKVGVVCARFNDLVSIVCPPSDGFTLPLRPRTP